VQAADSFVIPAGSQPATVLTVSAGAEVCSARSVAASRVLPMTRTSTSVVTSCTVEDPTSVISALPGSRVTLAELQPTQPTLVSTDTSHDLKTCFTTAEQMSDGSSRTSYGPVQISAQVLSLPRSITNCRNLSRPLTLCYAGRQVIVPPSCIVLSAEGAKLLLPPQTIIPSKPPPDPVDLSSENTGSISSTVDKKTSGLIPVSPSKSGSASETASPKKTDSLIQLSGECKEKAAVEESHVTSVTVREESQPSLETHYSTESATDQQESSADDQKCPTDQCQETDISKLNDSSLVRIFTFLRLTDLLQASHVCSRWNAVARDPSLVNRRILLVTNHLQLVERLTCD